jgi:hypothetical protein
MSYSIIIPSLLITFLSLTLLAALLVPILSNLYFGFSIRGAIELSTVKRCQKKLSQIRELFSHGNYKEGIKLAPDAFFLESVKYHEYLLPKIHEHNLALLAEIVREGEGSQGSLRAIPVLEELLEERSRLQRLLFDTYQSATARRKRKRRSNSPDWAAAEFKKKEASIKNKLKINKSEIQESLNSLATSSPQYTASTSEVTYH